MNALPVTTTVDGNLAALIANGCTRETLQTALSRVGRNAEPALLAELDEADLLSRHLAAWAVPSAWCGAEWPLRVLEEETWRYLFDLAGYTVDGIPTTRPAEPVTLFRGADFEHRLGWSWTDHPSTAAWFAQRSIWPAPGLTWEATVAPERLLARIGRGEVGRGEAEWVVDPAGLVVAPYRAVGAR